MTVRDYNSSYFFLTAASCPSRDFNNPPLSPTPTLSKNVQQTFVLHSKKLYCMAACIVLLHTFALLRTLYRFDTHLHVLTHFVRFWATFSCFDIHSHVLTHFNMFWHTFSCFDILSHVLTHSLMIWHIFSCFHKSFYVLTYFLMFW
jgi:hypothetical protein